MSERVLEVKNAVVEFSVQGGVHRALDGVSLELYKGETLAVVGESGCGKTTLAKSVLGLQPLTSGEILLGSRNVIGPQRGMASSVGMVWQDPFASLDPKWTVGMSVEEPVRLSGKKADLSKIFKEVGLDERHINRYPHQLSGGQRQRVAIGRALALRPPLVICDEPTAALDLSIQAQILNLLKDIQDELRCAYLYISHDLMTVQYLATRVAVMYLGRIVEMGPTEEIFNHPRHPYTRALLESAPTLDKIGELPASTRGELPDPRTRFKGCRFASRCPKVQPHCQEHDPVVNQLDSSVVWCHYPNESTTA